MPPKRAKPWHSTGDTPLAGDVGRRDKVRQGWKERIPKKIFFLPPGKGKERGTGHEGSPERPRPTSPPRAAAGLVGQGTHSSRLCGTALRVYLETILLFLLNRGRGGHARVGASRPGPPAGSCPAPSRHLPAPSRPVAWTPDRQLLRLPASPVLRPPYSPAGAEVTTPAAHRPKAPARARRGRRPVPAPSGCLPSRASPGRRVQPGVWTETGARLRRRPAVPDRLTRWEPRLRNRAETP